MADDFPGSPPPPDGKTMRRWWLLNCLRAMALAIVMFGMVMLVGKLGEPRAMGLYFIALGGLGFFLFPALFARRWRELDK